MIIEESVLQVADNSGAKSIKCIRIMGHSGKKSANIGDIIKASVRSISPNSKVAKGDVVNAIIVRTCKGVKREDGSVIRFNNNAVVLLNAQLVPIGTRIFGPITRELRLSQFMRIVSLAEEVL